MKNKLEPKFAKARAVLLQKYHDAFYAYVETADKFGCTSVLAFRWLYHVESYKEVLKDCFGLTEDEIDDFDSRTRREVRGR